MKTTIFIPTPATKTVVVAIIVGVQVEVFSLIHITPIFYMPLCSRSLFLNLYQIYSVVFCKVRKGKKILLISVNEPLKGSYNQLLTCLNDLLKQQMPMNDYTLGKKCLCPLISLYFPTSYFETELKRIQ